MGGRYSSNVMSNQARQLLEEVLRLPLEDRSQLIEQLLRSVESDEGKLSPEQWDRIWAEEINRRVREVDAGKVQLIDADDAFAEGRAVLKPAP